MGVRVHGLARGPAVDHPADVAESRHGHAIGGEAVHDIAHAVVGDTVVILHAAVGLPHLLDIGPGDVGRRDTVVEQEAVPALPHLGRHVGHVVAAAGVPLGERTRGAAEGGGEVLAPGQLEVEDPQLHGHALVLAARADRHGAPVQPRPRPWRHVGAQPQRLDLPRRQGERLQGQERVRPVADIRGLVPRLRGGDVADQAELQALRAQRRPTRAGEQREARAAAGQVLPRQRHDDDLPALVLIARGRQAQLAADLAAEVLPVASHLDHRRGRGETEAGLSGAGLAPDIPGPQTHAGGAERLDIGSQLRCDRPHLRPVLRSGPFRVGQQLLQARQRRGDRGRALLHRRGHCRRGMGQVQARHRRLIRLAHGHRARAGVLLVVRQQVEVQAQQPPEAAGVVKAAEGRRPRAGLARQLVPAPHVHAPVAAHGQVQGEAADREGDLDHPVLRRLPRGRLPVGVPGGIRAVRVIPRTQRVDDELVVVAEVAARVDEDLDLVIRPHHAVPLLHGGPQLVAGLLLTVEEEVERLAVAQRLHARPALG